MPGNQSPALAALNAAPFYTVAKLAALTWLAVILRIDAIVSPGGTGLIYLDLSLADQLRAEPERLHPFGL